MLNTPGSTLCWGSFAYTGYLIEGDDMNHTVRQEYAGLLAVEGDWLYIIYFLNSHLSSLSKDRDGGLLFSL